MGTALARLRCEYVSVALAPFGCDSVGTALPRLRCEYGGNELVLTTAAVTGTAYSAVGPLKTGFIDVAGAELRLEDRPAAGASPPVISSVGV